MILAYEEDISLAQRICQKDGEAMSTFSQKFYGDICRWAQYTGIKDKEDLAHDAYAAALESIQKGQYQGRSSLRTYVRRIFTYTLVRYLRKKPQQDFNAIPDEAEITNHNPLPHEELIKQEQDQIVLAAIETLIEDERTAINLFYHEDHSYKEAAEIMGKTVGAFSGLLHRAIEKIKDFVVKVS